MSNERMHYYYIVIGSPAGTGGYFYRDSKHPLDPNAMLNHQVSLSRSVQLKTKQIVRPEEITWLNLIELPKEVAKERWPEDFVEIPSFSEEWNFNGPEAESKQA